MYLGVDLDFIVYGMAAPRNMLHFCFSLLSSLFILSIVADEINCLRVHMYACICM